MKNVMTSHEDLTELLYLLRNNSTGNLYSSLPIPKIADVCLDVTWSGVTIFVRFNTEDCLVYHFNQGKKYEIIIVYNKKGNRFYRYIVNIKSDYCNLNDFSQPFSAENDDALEEFTYRINTKHGLSATTFFGVRNHLDLPVVVIEQISLNECLPPVTQIIEMDDVNIPPPKDDFVPSGLDEKYWTDEDRYNKWHAPLVDDDGIHVIEEEEEDLILGLIKRPSGPNWNSGETDDKKPDDDFDDLPF